MTSRNTRRETCGRSRPSWKMLMQCRRQASNKCETTAKCQHDPSSWLPTANRIRKRLPEIFWRRTFTGHHKMRKGDISFITCKQAKSAILESVIIEMLLLRPYMLVAILAPQAIAVVVITRKQNNVWTIPFRGISIPGTGRSSPIEPAATRRTY